MAVHRLQRCGPRCRRTQPVRHDAGQLAVAALYSGESITAAQIEQVTRILAANSDRIESGPQAGWVKAGTVNWTVAKEQLQQVLSPSQVEFLQSRSEGVANMDKLWAQIEERTRVLTAQFKGTLAAHPVSTSP